MRRIVLIVLIAWQTALMSQNSADTTAFVPEYKPGTVYTIKTNIGTSHRGFVVKESKDDILLESKNSGDTLRIRKSNITGSKQISNPKVYHDKVFDEDYYASNYIISSSAFLFEEATSTSTAHWFLVENIDYAITENFAITANSLVFYPFSIGVKCAFKIDELNYAGANAFAMGDIFSGGFGSSMFIGYGGILKFTHGTQNKNFTFSAGVLGLNSDLFAYSPSSPFLNLGFVSIAYSKRFAEHLSFNAEGWYFPETQTGIGGLGLRVMNGDQFSWNFGCYTFLENYNSALKINMKTIPIPYIGYTRKFD